MDNLLSQLERLLYGYNYQVFLRQYCVPFTPNAKAEWYIAQALGKHAVIGGVVTTSGPELLADVEQSLRYTGDQSSGPKRAVLSSEKFNALVTGVLTELKTATRDAHLIAAFWLRDGPPAYPVFWDFAFVISGPSGGMVFIGSSSD